MKITIYSVKGSAGKTPIATNIALDRGYAIGTNEPYHILDTFIPEERLISIEQHEEFPTIPDNIDIVFDLAGSISRYASSIPSAIRQSDLVIVPIYNEIKSLNSGIHTIFEVRNFNKNILVVATKLQKQKGEIFKDWSESSDFLNIYNAVKSKVGFDLEFLPLKFSKVFDIIFEQELSIAQIMKKNALASYTYREIAQQFNNLYNLIDKNHA